MSKELTAEEKAFAYLQDKNYTKVGEAATSAGAETGKLFRKAEEGKQKVTSRLGSIKDAFNIERKRKGGKQAERLDRRDKATAKTGFDRLKNKAILRDKIKTSNMHRIGGGTVLGAVGGGALGAGVAHLATSKSRKRVAFLESKGDSMSNKERAELVAKKSKVKNAKIISGTVGAVAGGIGGHIIGKNSAKKNSSVLKNAYRKALGKSVGEYNTATKRKTGYNVD